MWKYLIAIAAVMLIGFGIIAGVGAQTGTEADAISLATKHPAFALMLDSHPGWKASAYDTQTSYNIWRVQFWSESGEELGFADVSLEKEKVYSWQTSAGITDEQREKAAKAIATFIRQDAELSQLIGKVDLDYLWVDYEGSFNVWVAHVERGAESVNLILQFDSADPMAFQNGRVYRIEFPNVLSYSAWIDAKKAEATALAFSKSEVAAALRDKQWQSEVERTDDSAIWVVKFMVAGEVAIQATVNVSTGDVIQISS